MPNWVASCHVDLGQTEETAPAFVGQCARTAVMRAPTNDKKPIIFSLLIIHIYIYVCVYNECIHIEICITYIYIYTLFHLYVRM